MISLATFCLAKSKPLVFRIFVQGARTANDCRVCQWKWKDTVLDLVFRWLDGYGLRTDEELAMPRFWRRGWADF